MRSLYSIIHNCVMQTGADVQCSNSLGHSLHYIKLQYTCCRRGFSNWLKSLLSTPTFFRSPAILVNWCPRPAPHSQNCFISRLQYSSHSATFMGRSIAWSQSNIDGCDQGCDIYKQLLLKNCPSLMPIKTRWVSKVYSKTLAVVLNDLGSSALG